MSPRDVNEVHDHKTTYIAVEVNRLSAKNHCKDCAFDLNHSLCYAYNCAASQRSDKRDVIFIDERKLK